MKEELLKQLQQQLLNAEPDPTTGGIVITINGNNGEGHGIGNTVIKTDKVVHRKIVKVKTGDGTITAAQKARLQRLVKQWVELYNQLHQKPKTYASAWSAVNRRAKVNSYHEIKEEDYAAVEQWLIKQIGIKNAMPSAKKKTTDWRSNRIKGIQSRCNELGIQEQRKAYMKKTFGKESLTLLSDDDVDRVYRWVMSKKKQ